MSMMDKIKSMFGGGAAASNDTDHAGHDHAGHDHSHEHDAPAAPLDPVGTTTPDPAPEGEHQH